MEIKDLKGNLLKNIIDPAEAMGALKLVVSMLEEVAETDEDKEYAAKFKKGALCIIEGINILKDL